MSVMNTHTYYRCHVCSNLLDSKCLSAGGAAWPSVWLTTSTLLNPVSCVVPLCWGGVNILSRVPLCLCIITGRRRVIYNLRGGTIGPLVGPNGSSGHPRVCLVFIQFFLHCFFFSAALIHVQLGPHAISWEQTPWREFDQLALSLG